MKNMDNFFSPYLSPYKASCSTQQFVVGAVLMDLSIAFGCIPHDLLIAKLAVYGFEEETLYLFILGK